MINDLHIGDGTWELRIFVTDLKTERLLRVKGDLHIGGLMLKLVEDLDMAIDWSDHALWWPKKKCWLTRTRSTLDQCGVQADALLHFTPMHKTCRIQLPDLRYIDYRVDFSIKCFTSVVKLCKEFGIRYPEELSFCRPLVNENLKKNQQKIGVTAKQRGEYVPTKNGLNNLMNTSNNSKNSTSISSLIDNRVQNMPTHNDKTPTPVRNGNGYIHGNNLPNQNGFSTLVYNLNAPSTTTPLTSENIYSNELTLPDLSQSPSYLTAEAKSCLLKPKTLQEKARMNVAWLDSSLSLYEQNIEEFDLILLRYKYLSFYDLNSKIDGVRINQIYEQARWSLINEHVECTEAEMYMFAGLQLQINLPTINPDLAKDNSTSNQLNKQTSVDEEIDSALTELQLQLEGVSLTDSKVKNLTKFNQNSSSNNITHIPELTDYLKLIKAKRFTLKSYKQYYFVFKDTRLICYKSREERGGQPILTINLKGAEVTPEVNLSQGKYSVKLEVPDYSYNNNSTLNNSSFNSSGSMGSMNEYWLRFSNEEQYARWLGAFKLAVEGRTMADAVNYENEVKQIIDLLSMQHPVLHSGSNKAILNQSYVHDIPLEDYMATKFLRKVKSRSHILQRILEANANVKNLSQIDAKLKYIKAWQALPDFGVSLFVVKFADSKKEELLGVASNRIMRMDLHTGDHLKTWNFSSMKSWNVNWEIKQMQVQFEDDNARFYCLSADCKVIHEFIGGYIFLSMRSKEQNQTLNEELFHKLTGGWF